MILDRNEYISGGNITAGKNFATSSAPTSLPAQVQQATYVAPTYTPPPAFVAPTYDEGRITDIAQQQASGTIRGLRSSIQKISGARYDNPNVKRMTLREALAGYGQGVQNAMSKASESARSLYNQEYGAKADELKTNYGTNVQASQAQYQAANQAALAQYQAQSQRSMAEYQTAWSNYNAQQSRNLEQQALDIKKQELSAKSNPMGFGVYRPPQGSTPQQNAIWFKEHGIY